MLNFGWWRDKDNREGAKSIVDILKVVVPALVLVGGAALGVFYATGDKSSAPAGNTTTIEGNTVNTGDGSNVNIGGTQTVNQ